jgi:hypothetical protein
MTHREGHQEMNHRDPVRYARARDYPVPRRHTETAPSSWHEVRAREWRPPPRQWTHGRWAEGRWTDDATSYQQGHGYGVFDDDPVDDELSHLHAENAEFGGPPLLKMEGRRTRPSYRGIGPKGYVRSDERIREQVCEALTDHDGVDAREIEVGVQDGEVTLAGSVPERAMKRYAEMAAENCRGVKDVHNQIRVKPEEERHSPRRIRDWDPTQS